MAVHLFILYWGMLSFITPPVALGAFAAASIARAQPLATGFAAMRLGSVIYFVPFMFVLNPALILHDSAAAFAAGLVEALAGILLLVWGIQAWVPGLGGRWAVWQRLMLGVGGVLVALPPLLPALTGTARGSQIALGLALALAALLPRLLRRGAGNPPGSGA
jgi:TRAP-type uncharacterized transport system fused permease subunit